MKINSPCINNCVMIDNKCSGCYRTLDEISKWVILSDNKKLQIINRIKSKTKTKENQNE